MEQRGKPSCWQASSSSFSPTTPIGVRRIERRDVTWPLPWRPLGGVVRSPLLRPVPVEMGFIYYKAAVQTGNFPSAHSLLLFSLPLKLPAISLFFEPSFDSNVFWARRNGDLVASRYKQLSTGVPFIYKTNAFSISIDCKRGRRIGNEQMYFAFCGWKKPRVGSFAILFTMVDFTVWKWKSATATITITISLACVKELIRVYKCASPSLLCRT